jgi:hypothetical protein
VLWQGAQPLLLTLGVNVGNETVGVDMHSLCIETLTEIFKRADVISIGAVRVVVRTQALRAPAHNAPVINRIDSRATKASAR